jgi:ribose transport system substrate-binding protein
MGRCHNRRNDQENDNKNQSGRLDMERRSVLGGVGLGLVGAASLLTAGRARADTKTFTVALIPGLTTDAFYITMHRGAQAAAEALGVKLVFQGAPSFNAVEQVPVLDAVIARKPDTILIAPTDKVQLIEPLKAAVNAGIPVITVDTYIGGGTYQTGSGNADFPLSYIASNNTHGGAGAGEGHRRQGQGLCGQCPARRLDDG